jgi:hypothetical protein
MQIEGNTQAGSLPFLGDVPELLRVRVLPAEFARILGVSKQSVSRWIKAGKVTLTFDGRIDVQRGVQQVLRNTDPGQLRARVLRQAVEDVQQLREAVANAEEREADLRRQIVEAQRRAAASDELVCRLTPHAANILDLVVINRADLAECTDATGCRLALLAVLEDAWELAADRAAATTSTGETPDDWAAAGAAAEAVAADAAASPDEAAG